MEYMNLGSLITVAVISFILGMWFKKLRMETEILKTNRLFKASFLEVKEEVMMELAASRDEREGLENMVLSIEKELKAVNTQLQALKKEKKPSSAMDKTQKPESENESKLSSIKRNRGKDQ